MLFLEIYYLEIILEYLILYLKSNNSKPERAQHAVPLPQQVVHAPVGPLKGGVVLELVVDVDGRVGVGGELAREEFLAVAGFLLAGLVAVDGVLQGGLVVAVVVLQLVHL